MSDVIAIIANVSLTLSFIAALIFGMAQVKAMARDRKERLTLDVLRDFETREFAELMVYVNFQEMPKNNEELNKLPFQQRVMFVQFGQKMESLGIMAGEGLIDIDLVDITLGSFVTTAWKKYEKLFFNMRVTDPFIGEY